MPQQRDPGIQSPASFRQALRNPGSTLKERYRDDPIGLAERLGLKLPEKPVVKMIRLGVISEEEALQRFGPVEPGIRDLVLEVCNGEITSAVVVGPRGGGKALSIFTPIPTPAGWKQIGDLVEGDVVFDDQGKPCRVVNAFPIMEHRKCYEIVFSDGSWICADADHLWQTKTQLERAANLVHQARQLRSDGWHGQWQGERYGVRTTEDIRQTLTTGERRDRNHSVDNAAPLDLPWRKLPVDPYILGLWLGDGCCQNGWITVGDDDLTAIVSAVKSKGASVKTRPDSGDNWRFKVDGLPAKLRHMGLLDQHKHVPAPYLRASKSQRLELLRGLMDSDGTTRNSSNNCQFDNTNEDLADAVEELVVSLGWKCSRHAKIAKLYGKECGAVYRVSFRPTEQVFRNPRKASRLDFSVRQSSRHLIRTISEVRDTPSLPVRCIEVDSPSHLYLAGRQMVPTHNSQSVSFIEFDLSFVKDFDALNLGGSELQADQVYQYIQTYVENDKEWKSLIVGDLMRERTTLRDGNWIRVLAASQKSTRSPHAGGGGGKKRGGILVLDEEAEAAPEIVNSALPTINTARPSVSVRSSTFHNAFGTFADVVDNHASMGYKLYRWDVFDVAERCDCIDTCQSSEKCFREDHIEQILNPQTNQVEDKVVHKAYCGGRAMYADGWVPIAEIEKLWRRINRHHGTWEVEQMGSRPSTAGFVIKDQVKFSNNLTILSGDELYVPGAPLTICVDWGTVAAGVGAWQEVWTPQGMEYNLVACEQLEEYGVDDIVSAILMLRERFTQEFLEVAADIGGGGNYMNPLLRTNHGLPVRDVNFNEEKEAAAAAWNVYNEAGKINVPAGYEKFSYQVRRWKRDAGGRIKKGNDHLCDMSICFFAKFIEQLGLTNMRILPRTFQTGQQVNREVERGMHGEKMATGRAPIVRSLSSKRGGWR
jgi:hypothetical protein